MTGSGVDVDVSGLLGRLIGFDTASDKSALPRIDFFEGSLDDLGVRSMRVPDETKCKASLIATIGSPGRSCLVLSGHTDVVPADGQAWSSNPFRCVHCAGTAGECMHRLSGPPTAAGTPGAWKGPASVPNAALTCHIRVAYRTDEHVESDRLYRCTDFLDRLVARVALTS